MKKTICKFLVLSVLISVLPFSASCGNESGGRDKLTYYDVTGDYYQLYDIIEKYNLYCTQNYDESYQIEIVEFENEDDMYTRLSAEIMAGQGPDIFSLDQTLPFEKLMRSNAFADINELIESDNSEDKLDLSEYNRVVFAAGQYEGGQYIVPAFYGLNSLIADKDELQKYNLPTENGRSLVYSEIDDLFDDYFQDENRICLMQTYDFSFMQTNAQLLYRLLYSFVDFENGKSYFESDEFSSALDSVQKLMDCISGYDIDIDGSNVLFDPYSYSITNMAFINCNDNEKDKTNVFYNGFNRSSKEVEAVIQLGVAVNANSKLKDKALAFIKYLLSEDFQEYYCGDKAGSTYGGSNVISFSVRNEAVKNAIAVADSDTESEFGVSGTDNEFMQAYINSVQNITDANLYFIPYDSYYSQKVIGDVVGDYFSGKISKSKFIQRLTSATEIYMTE